MGTGDTETKWCNSCGKKYEMYSMDIIIKLESVFEIVIWMNSIQFSYQADKKQFRLLNRNGTKERRKKTFVSIFFGSFVCALLSSKFIQLVCRRTITAASESMVSKSCGTAALEKEVYRRYDEARAGPC